MIIADLKTYCVSIPYKVPERWAYGLRKGSSPVIVEVITDTGLSGFGEIKAPLVSTTVEHMIQHYVGPIVIGENPFDIERIKRKVLSRGLMFIPNIACYLIAGIEIALWDIIGKKLMQPVYRLMGGGFRHEVPFMAYLFLDEPEIMAANALNYLKQGVTTVKLKVGIDSEEDVARVALIREKVGPKLEIVVDANQAWSPGTALRIIRRLEKYDLMYVEQPLRRDDFVGHANLRKRVNTPIGLNESVFITSDILRCIMCEAADLIVTDPIVPGGLSEAKKVCAIADAGGLPVVGHSAGELGIGLAAFLHLAASTANFIHSNDSYYDYLVDDIITKQFAITNGCIEVPDNPGLGIEIDRKKLENYSSGTFYSAYEDQVDISIPFPTRL